MDGETPRERYRRALRAVTELRDDHPRLHESVMLVIAEALGQEVQRFYSVPPEKAEEEGARSHAAHRALNGVYATLSAPEGRIKALDNPPLRGKNGGKNDGAEDGTEVRQSLYERAVAALGKKLGVLKDPSVR